MLSVTGRSSEEIGDIAFANAVPLYELTPVHTSLEDAYLSLTRDDVEYRATGATPRRAAA